MLSDAMIKKYLNNRLCCCSNESVEVVVYHNITYMLTVHFLMMILSKYIN